MIAYFLSTEMLNKMKVGLRSLKIIFEYSSIQVFKNSRIQESRATGQGRELYRIALHCILCRAECAVAV